MNFRYPLHDLNHADFERLVVCICREILGAGVLTFSEGKDDGKDAKFTGKANKYPSESAPWDGKIIIQAKHTRSPLASCSDNSFRSILKKELVKIKQLKDENRLDYYLLFTNRKLSGVQDSKNEDIFSEAGIEPEKCSIQSLENIQQYLTEYANIVKELGLNKLLLPLNFYEEDIRNIIVAFSEASNEYEEGDSDLNRILIDQKNELNNLTKEYFDNVMSEHYSYFDNIREFLSDPKNEEYRKKYDNTISDLNAKITIYRNEYAKFEEVIEKLYDKILDQENENLLNNRRMIRVFLHYMYNNCDIGRQS